MYDVTYIFTYVSSCINITQDTRYKIQATLFQARNPIVKTYVKTMYKIQRESK